MARCNLWKELRDLFAFEIAGGGQISIVNRLDRETSGLVLVAKRARWHADSPADATPASEEEYLAIVWGWPNGSTTVVDTPLDRQRNTRNR